MQRCYHRLLLLQLGLFAACASPSGGGGYYYAGGNSPADTSQASANNDTIGTGADASLGGNWTGWKPTKQEGGSLPVSSTPDQPVETSTKASELFKEAAQACAELIIKTQTDVVAKCSHSPQHLSALSWAVEAAKGPITTDARFVGLDWLPKLAVAPLDQPGGQSVSVYTCASDPTGNTNGLNAFALQQGVWMLDPLLFAFAESAAVWDALRQQAGPALDDASEAELAKSVMSVFLYAEAGEFGKMLALDQVVVRLTTSPFAWQAYVGASSFVLFHEMGHANLSHGLIKCAITQGVDKMLGRRQIQLTATELQELQAEIGKLARSTEAQADIYGLTLLKSLGFGREGPTIFLVGVLGLKIAACSDGNRSEEAVLKCALEDFDPVKTSHPPLQERATLIKKIFDDGQDLTYLLETANLSRVRTKTCGNGICEATEQVQDCPDDCGRRGPVCGDNVCAVGESATCPKDCKPPHFCDSHCLSGNAPEDGTTCYCDASCKDLGDCCNAEGTAPGGPTCAGSTCEGCL